MCLGIPGRVVEVLEGYGGQLALVDVSGVQRKINIGLLDSPPQPSEWVIIHMGFALEQVDEATAHEAFVGLQILGRPAEAE
ncbi:HypC/HybG/HupF family hydrogenase formation chaperone [Sinomonas terrae]|uniref:HypC/HybG/HupF family hydrogenase formation chaperone n=1 Tax=Sinomonas terrae TaxID=2908838 RepID=A0ABS9TW45_9MICC|nr:HypC/HybG/HupF family hydrogenase formation chaperone [Sinomonas terrae]MCH6468585.1 HypC/HybG/HupF family hydrogenase formation chaperone [Sinomonas terrae]